jgi:hypothetical protein
LSNEHARLTREAKLLRPSRRHSHAVGAHLAGDKKSTPVYKVIARIARKGAGSSRLASLACAARQRLNQAIQAVDAAQAAAQPINSRWDGGAATSRSIAAWKTGLRDRSDVHSAASSRGQQQQQQQLARSAIPLDEVVAATRVPIQTVPKLRYFNPDNAATAAAAAAAAEFTGATQRARYNNGGGSAGSSRISSNMARRRRAAGIDQFGGAVTTTTAAAQHGDASRLQQQEHHHHHDHQVKSSRAKIALVGAHDVHHENVI